MRGLEQTQKSQVHWLPISSAAPSHADVTLSETLGKGGFAPWEFGTRSPPRQPLPVSPRRRCRCRCRIMSPHTMGVLHAGQSPSTGSSCSIDPSLKSKNSFARQAICARMLQQAWVQPTNTASSCTPAHMQAGKYACKHARTIQHTHHSKHATHTRTCIHKIHARTHAHTQNT